MRFRVKGHRKQDCAGKLLEWIGSNEDKAGTFALKLLESLQTCCSHPRAVQFHTLKEHVWENFYKLRSSGFSKAMVSSH